MTGSQMAKMMCVLVDEANGMPSGHLYARMLPHCETLEIYDLVLDRLIQAKWLTRNKSHWLEIGPGLQRKVN